MPMGQGAKSEPGQTTGRTVQAKHQPIHVGAALDAPPPEVGAFVCHSSRF